MALFSRRKTPAAQAGSDAAQAEAALQAAVDAAGLPRVGRRRTVGQLLRETREGYNSDIPRVAAALRIRPAYLEAIEAGRYDQLPGPAYALGFVRAYAIHLGLDGDEAVRRFKLEAAGYDGHRDLSFPVPLAARSIPGWSMLLAAVILAFCGYGLWDYLSLTAQPRPERVSPLPPELAAPAPPAPAASPSTAAASPAPSADIADKPAPVAPPTAEAPASPVLATSEPSAPPAAAEPPPQEAAASTAAAPLAEPGPSGPTPALSVPPPPSASPLPPLPPQTAALPNMPPSAGATPVPDQPRVFGLANGDTRIVIHAVHDTWLQVRDRDHLPIFTQTLHAGDIYHVPDRPGLVMRVARGAAIAITVDGLPTRPIGSALQPNVAMDPARLLAGTAVLEQTPSRAGAAH